MYRVAFTLDGTSPILFHADDVEASDSLKEWRKAPENSNLSVPGDDRSPAWTWQTYLYHDGANIVWPSTNLMVGLRQAGAQVKIKGNKTYKELTQSGMLIPGEYIRFEGAGGRVLTLAEVRHLEDMQFSEQAEAVKELGFRLFVKRAKVGQAKHVRVRARFDSWRMQGVLDVYAAEEITFERLQLFFEIAGRGGQGDWRPACKTPGPYGQFRASLKEVKPDWVWPWENAAA